MALRGFLNEVADTVGAQAEEVDEPFAACRSVVLFELEDYPEPKALKPGELRALVNRLGGSHRAAAAIGASEAFVRQNAKA